jgi:hypothetical protein
VGRRLKRYAERREWKPYRSLPRPPENDDPGPRGEFWIVDAALGEVERVDEKTVDEDDLDR